MYSGCARRIQKRVAPGSHSHARAPVDGAHFDVVIAGGGINGASIARELTRAGQRTLLLEQNDFGSGTTSRSTRIIHGGLRYLEHGELDLVRESLLDRERLLREHPNLVERKRFLLAIRAGHGRRSALALRCGLWLYSLLGRSRAIERKQSGLRDLDRWLASDRKMLSFDYEDAQCEFPERLVSEWVGEAGDAGAIVRNHTRVLQAHFLHREIRGLTLLDEIEQREYEVTCRTLINATGPWADRFCDEAGVPLSERLVGGVRGSHIVVRNFSGAPEQPLYVEAADGRPIFVIPWNGMMMIGTTEVGDDGDPGRTAPSADEIAYLLRAVQTLFPSAALDGDSIVYSFAGVRPLPYSPGKKFGSVTRRHSIYDHKDDHAAGVFSVVGGKLTTAATLARDVAARLGIRSRARGDAFTSVIESEHVDLALRMWSQQVSQQAKIPVATARVLAEWHGRRALCIARLAGSNDLLRLPLCAHTQHIVAEAVEAFHYEYAATLADILLRRVPVALGECWSPRCSLMASVRIGKALSWSEAATGEQLDRFELERSRFLQAPQRELWPAAI